MNDFKLKLILSLLTGVVFAFIFILLAFAAPLKKQQQIIKKPEGKLEQVAKSARERK